MNPRHLLILCVLLTACARDTHPQQVEIQSLLDRYFTTWTAQDMQGYAACFDPPRRCSWWRRTDAPPAMP